jgi:uncharacterized protein (TIGR02996 family)
MVLPEGILRDIYDYPFDDVPWLVYADWLEEQDDPRARLIRIEGELAHSSGQDVVLNLNAQAITDAGLIHLRGLKKLENLDLDRTRVTVQGTRELSRFLPTASIVVADTVVMHTKSHS